MHASDPAPHRDYGDVASKIPRPRSPRSELMAIVDGASQAEETSIDDALKKDSRYADLVASLEMATEA